MKKMICLFWLISQFASAGYYEKVIYWYSQNVSTNIPPIQEIVTMIDYSDGQGVHLNWHIVNPPSKATIDAIDDATATAFVENKRQDIIADYEKWRDEERKLCKLFVKEINKLRTLHGLAPYTKAQVVQALKNEK